MKDYEVFVPSVGTKLRALVPKITITADSVKHAMMIAKHKGIPAPIVAEKQHAKDR